jgi:outer membrane receptor protein involved in Fe transport
VLKGPQGTVFGKNTSAGVINVVTRNPDYTQSAEGEVTVGNYGALGVAGCYNDPLGDYAAFRIYAAKRDATAGWTCAPAMVRAPRTDDYDQNFHTLRGKLLLEPTDNLEILLSADFTSRDENCCTAVQTGHAAAPPRSSTAWAAAGAIAVPANPFARVAYSNRDTTQDIKDKGCGRGQLGRPRGLAAPL